MKHLKLFETFTNKVTIGIDIDGTICNFRDAYNLTYKKYFPEKEIDTSDDWNWYKKMDYDGEKPYLWFKSKKAEIFELAKPYQDAINSINNIYDFIKTYGYSLKIITVQPTEEAKESAKKWLQKYNFKYDDIVFAEKTTEKWKYADIIIDDAIDVINSKPLSKVSIKIEHKYNENVEGDINIQNIGSLTIDVMKSAFSKLNNKTTI